MGRTVPSFRMLPEGMIEDFSVFRRVLRGEDKVLFDRQMNVAMAYALSSAFAPLLEPMDANWNRY